MSRLVFFKCAFFNNFPIVLSLNHLFMILDFSKSIFESDYRKYNSVRLFAVFSLIMERNQTSRVRFESLTVVTSIISNFFHYDS